MKPLSLERFPTYLKTHKAVPKYNSDKEAKLPHAYWDLDRASIDEALKEISKKVEGILTGIPQNDRELHHVLKTANRLSQIERGKPVNVALLGAQGAGKSLLINALFDCDGLSLTGADGAACTASIIKYALYRSRGTTDDDGAKFFAEVQFLSAEKIEEMIREHTRHYSHYHNNGDDSEEEDSPGKQSFQQDELDRRQRDTAEDVFQTLFGSRDQFLETWASASTKEFVRLCELKCREAMRKSKANAEDVALFDGKDQHELLSKIKPYLTDVAGQQCLWPLVDHVCVRFDHPLLREGIVLIDLPGSGDTNISRTRHAEEIKETADVQIILADTIRITTDDMVINATRAAILNHGAANVKLVATKIDSISPNQLSQCSGNSYDQIKELIQEAEKAATTAEEEDDASKSDQLGKYKTYLERNLKQLKIAERAKDISNQLKTKFQGRTEADVPQFFHVSAADYMRWIMREKLIFRDQPALPPALTGVPAIRQYMFDLPARHNLNDVASHINVFIPAYIEKIKRVISQSDRDVGFRTLAEEFDILRKEVIAKLLSQAKDCFRKISAVYFDRVLRDTTIYKQQINDRLIKDWFALRGPTFNKILKSRGVVPKMSSKAKGLENGCHWNQELSHVLAPAFKRWSVAYTDRMKDMWPALRRLHSHIHLETMFMLDNSAANIMVVDRAKAKWGPTRMKLQVKVDALKEKFEKIHNDSVLWATMESDRENSLVASITDPYYDAVFGAAPALKPSSTPKKRLYVTPKVKFQKNYMAKLFISSDDHFVDNVFRIFQEEYNKVIDNLLEEHFGQFSEVMEHYSAVLRAEAPIDYTITPIGEQIRAELEQLLPTLEGIAEKLRGLLPKAVKQEEDSAELSAEGVAEGSEANLVAIMNEMNKKRKRSEADKPKVQIKKEETSGSKRLKV